MRTSGLAASLAAVLALMSCASQATSTPAAGARGLGSACGFDPAGDVDCARACAAYRAGFERAAAAGRHGEFMRPEQCMDTCASFNSAAYHAQPDTVIQWNCWARHDVCSDERRRCEVDCRVGSALPPEPLGGPAYCDSPSAHESS